MTRYEWPPAAGRPRGLARARRSDVAGQAAGSDPAARPYALARRRSDQAEALRVAAPRLAPGQPPGPFTNLWLPMGPGTTLRGLTDADPRVSGRVRDLAVSDDGTRIYAAAAGGGVWYSGDSGNSWLPVGTYTLGGDVTTDAPSSTTLAIGALHVRFDPNGDDPAHDEVWAGTGEPDPRGTPREFGVVANFGGIGILHASGPVHTVQQNPDTDPWEHGAQPGAGYPGLRGQGVYAFAADPADPAAVIAGTTAGLHHFDPAAGPLTEPWSLVTVAAWEALLMIPLTGTVGEMKLTYGNTKKVADAVLVEMGVTVKYTVGTMIEVPRAALIADKIAQDAEFFSFGTNDLTQMTFGYSRDDVAKFLPEYLQKGLLPHDPFSVLDQEGVGELVKIGIERGRRTRPDLKIGICGEHGGEPSSVEFCHRVGMTYVSCSPFMIPIARLSAAQARIKAREASAEGAPHA